MTFSAGKLFVQYWLMKVILTFLYDYEVYSAFVSLYVMQLASSGVVSFSFDVSENYKSPLYQTFLVIIVIIFIIMMMMMVMIIQIK